MKYRDGKKHGYVAGYTQAVRDVVEALREEASFRSVGPVEGRLVLATAADFIESRFSAPSDPCTDCDGTGIGGHGGTCPACKGSKSAPSPGPEETCPKCEGRGRSRGWQDPDDGWVSPGTECRACGGSGSIPGPGIAAGEE